MLTYLFRKRSTTGFSIEKLFDALYRHARSKHSHIARLEMPYGTTGLWSVLKNAWYVRRKVKGGILHITGDVHYGALLAPFTKTVITVHDCVVLQRGRGLKKFILWLLWYRLPLSFATAVTVISEQTRRELLSVVRIPERKVHLIPNFVSPDYRHTAKQFDADLPRILHVGTRSNKNLPRVIEALRGMHVLLVIVGVLDDAQRRLLHTHVIRYENHPTPDDQALLHLYRTADLISFPSTYEGFGMPIIEAQAVGRAVLTSDMEPMRSVAGQDGALLVDPLSITAIRSGFVALMQDAGLRDHLVASGLRNAAQYTLDAVALRYQHLYEQLHV